MADSKHVLSQFWELADSRCTIDLKDGTHLEGYFLEVLENHIAFGVGGPCAPNDDLHLPFDDICLQSLHFYSDIENRYVHALWNDETKMFNITPCH